MGRPAKVTGECDAQQACLVDDFERFRVREVELWKEVKLLGKVERHNLRLLEVDLHQVFIGENNQISKLMLEHRVFSW